MHVADGEGINSLGDGPKGADAHTSDGRGKELHVSLEDGRGSILCCHMVPMWYNVSTMDKLQYLELLHGN